MPWSELERRLSAGRPSNVPPNANGGRQPRVVAQAPAVPGHHRQAAGSVPYAELHCHSNFSFLDGASHPEELAEEAARLGLEALAITDHDGFYGVVRFAEAAGEVGLPTVFGAELSLGLTKPQNGIPDPEGNHLVVLARDPEGYARLAPTISAGPAGRRREGQADLRPERDGRGARRPLARAHRLPQGRGARRAPARRPGRRPPRARRPGRRVRAAQRRRRAVGPRRPARLGPQRRARRAAARAGVECVATNNVHYATPGRRRLATALAAVRARRSLDEIDGWLPAGAGAHLRSGAEQARRFARYPGCGRERAAVAAEARLRPAPRRAQAAALPVPRRPRRDGVPAPLTAGGARPLRAPARARAGRAPQIDHELDIIEALGFPGYFLIVWDIVEFCRTPDIFCQGRGSAANSAVCYALGITNADAVVARPAVRALPVARARRPARHRHRHRERPARGGHPVRLRALRPRARRAGGERHHLPSQVVGPRHGQGARLLDRPAGRVVEAGRRVGQGALRPQPDHDIPPAGARRSRTRSSTSRATSASTPAGW